MYITYRHKYFCIMLLSVLSTPSSAQVNNAKCPETTSKAVVAGGGCLLGATLGTFIFPGVGTAVGCAAVSLGSWTWAKIKTPDVVQAKDCTKETREGLSNFSSTEELVLNSRNGDKP